MKRHQMKLTLRSNTIRTLGSKQLREVVAGYNDDNSGSQQPSGATCPPPKNGEGSGCITN